MATHYLNFDAASDGIGTIGNPWKSFDTAQSGIARGDTVIVSGTLRDTITFLPAKGGATSTSKTKWLGTPEAPFTVTGGEKLTGFVQCTSGDSNALGLGNPNMSSIWKTTITKSSLPGGDPYSANICEAGVQLPICVSRALTFDKFFITKSTYFHTASSVTLSGAQITGFRLPAVTDLHTKSQIERARVYFVGASNRALQSAILNFDETTKVISLATPNTYENSVLKDNFALANLLPVIKRGEWGFLDNGATVTIYVWPQNVANISGGIEYSSRSKAVYINGTSNLEIGFFKAKQTAGGGLSDGNIVNYDAPCSHVYIHNFESTDSLNTSDMYAGIFMNDVDDLELGYFDLRRLQNMWGLFFLGSNASAADAGNPGAVQQMRRAYVHHFTAAYVAAAAVRMFVTADSIFAFGSFWECSKRTHANKMNAYIQCTNLLWWGIDAEDADGYFSEQDSDSIVMAFCSSSATGGPSEESSSARGIYSQQKSSTLFYPGDAFGYKGGGLINCRVLPNRFADRAYSNSVKKGDDAVPKDRHTVRNNIYHGHGSAFTAAQAAVYDDWDNNILTAGIVNGPADELIADTVLYSGTGNTFTYPAESRARTKAAKDCTAYITSLQARFPKFTDWDKDMVGDTFTWANVGCGPTKNKDALYGEKRNVTYAGIIGGSSGGGGGNSSRRVISPGFKIKVAA